MEDTNAEAMSSAVTNGKDDIVYIEDASKDECKIITSTEDSATVNLTNGKPEDITITHLEDSTNYYYERSQSSSDRRSRILELKKKKRSIDISLPELRGSQELIRETRQVNCLVLGDMGVGKTTLIKSLQPEEPQPTEPEHTEPDTATDRTVHVWHGGDAFEITFYDSSGVAKEDFKNKSLPKQVELIILCFSVDNRESFDSIKTTWFPGSQQSLDIKYCPRYLLVGTKMDLQEQPSEVHVAFTEGIQLASEIGAANYVQCSAKSGENMDNMSLECAIALHSVSSRPKKKRPQKNSCLKCCLMCLCLPCCILVAPCAACIKNCKG